MNLVFFTHPSFVAHQSMPRFAHLLADGMRARGHRVATWTPTPVFTHLPAPASVKKWLGYADQFGVFPAVVRRRLRAAPADTLFVLTDHALGPWVPLVAHRAHAIHCHDFLAQRAAAGELPENVPGWTGQQYQATIRRGYARGKHFISVSEQTRRDLHRFMPQPPQCSEVVYNGLNQAFAPGHPAEARRRLGERLPNTDLSRGYVLHVGGNQWYKNRQGVLEIYDAWRATHAGALPLLLLGEAPTAALRARAQQSPYRTDIHWLSGVPDPLVRAAYVGATALLFPSLAEGFGWPIAEAMASGCPVITTDEAPMTEVAGGAGVLIPRRPADNSAVVQWAAVAARGLARVVQLGEAQRAALVGAGLANARRFDPRLAIDRIESIYAGILAHHRP